MSEIKGNFNPISNQLDSKDLNILLSKEENKTIFCFHNWIYWTFGDATKKHRVCSKCFKRQKDTQIGSKI